MSGSSLRTAAMMAALLGALGPGGLPAVAAPSEPERNKRPKDIANQYQVEAEKKRAKRRAKAAKQARKAELAKEQTP